MPGAASITEDHASQLVSKTGLFLRIGRGPKPFGQLQESFFFPLLRRQPFFDQSDQNALRAQLPALGQTRTFLVTPLGSRTL